MDNLSAQFLKIHKKKVFKQYDFFREWNKLPKVINKWDIINIKIDDLSDIYLQKWFVLFQDYIKKITKFNELNISNYYFNSFSEFKTIVLNSESLTDYAVKINNRKFNITLKDNLISNIVINFSNNHLIQINSLKKGEVKRSKKVFIGTQYTNLYEETKKNIKELLMKSNLIPIVLNEQQHNEIIDNKLYDEMNDCDFGIFDISADNSNVAYEAGYMLGKGKEIILVCNEIAFETIKFDFKHRNIVIFKSNEDFYEKLEKRLYSVITKIYI